ncbi:DNA polymerase III subunit gamma and tau [Micromonospora arborensis]|uniref:DNA polymerase III subunit gamma/tau n=1 Tax=Micromonospora arborensis TaxID=2116518 RepID=A0A318P425_9ACTN|nr:DNA polymerase III subunit gamma and tau [Micromonospora arborensis]PYC71263.1 DNA polymerase III subunit gamma and tau [Micromonospora arborensis]
MTLALYRKYRPRTFAEVIGQEHVTEPLKQALRSGRLNHAYLFSGPRGCGKTTSARIMARSLNCEQGPTPEPCGKCASCRSLAADGAGSIDVIEIDAASHGGVDDARELRERAFFAPANSRFKIYIIDEAHMVSTQGFNALLKLVEEPPEYVKFIFATTEPEKVLGTIRSRTHHYPFRLFPPKVVRPYLEQLTQAEGVAVEPAVFPLVVRAGGGSMRDSLSVLDQLIAGAGAEGVSYARAVALLGVTDSALIDEMCDALAAGDGAAAYATVDRVAEAGHDMRRFASDLLERLRDLIVIQQVPDAAAKGLIDGPADQIERMAAQASQLGSATLSRCADIVHNGLVEMRGTTAPRLLLELICARMLLPGADDSTRGLLQRLERMERRLTLSGTDAPSAAAGSAPATHPGVRPQPGTPVPAAATPAPVNAPTSAPPWAVDPAASPTRSAAASGAPTSAAPVSGAPASHAPISGAPASHAPVSGAPASHAPTSGALASDISAADSPIPASPGASTVAASAPEDRFAPGSPAGPGTGSPTPRRVVPPSAVLPDPATPEPPRPGAPAAALDAVAVRRVWPDVVGKVNRTNKRIAALMRDAVVRELDGDMLVLTVKSTVLAKMMADHAAVLTDALYEELGGRWQIRCEVAGERGGVSLSGPQRSPSAAPARPASAPDGPTSPTSAPNPTAGPAASNVNAAAGSMSAPNPTAVSAASNMNAAAGPTDARPAAAHPTGGAGQGARAGLPGGADARGGNGSGDHGAGRQGGTPPTAPADDEDDWPEAARPGGGAPTAEATDDEDWPEAARPGGASAGNDASPAGGPGSASTSTGAHGLGANGGNAHGTSAHGTSANGTSANGGSANGGNGNGTRATGGSTNGGNGNGTGSGGSGGPGPAAGGGNPGVRGNPTPAARQPASAGGAPVSSAIAAARAAAAGRGARTGAAARPIADAEWAGEPPYDPDFDGPSRGGRPGGAAAAAAPVYEGFDPGDEPLDEVIDEKTARESSEEQAVRLLRETFGAEKINEVDAR